MQKKHAAQGAYTNPEPVYDHTKLKELVAREIGVSPDEISEDEDLVDHGLDSVTAMRVLSSWQESGLDVDFSDMMRAPTITAWSNLVADQHRKDSQRPEGGSTAT
ncbi:hypothetical protein GCM10007079_08590 [Nocardiopsis terrae]|uniref:Aryl carrier-like protein n=1 Tax=Nocardiopsis terrae TaxID=372655 RepID=A0ABR9HD01_9ACTN|nr:phosphopantetheine-binding protein [Nocardiopsis terrae]MBE1456923.1 aryl carrier-like protein [Nocardiopsis terrae]GHC74373.1 hypothetical protein GCM10007079_08590 [Nocardiopsis terrae]